MVFPITDAGNRNHRKQPLRKLGFGGVVVDLIVGHMRAISSEFCAHPGSVDDPVDVSTRAPSRKNRKTEFFLHLEKCVLCLLVLVGSVFASNHPAITRQNANCALCHSDMTKGQSVHSEGELSCALCHSARTDGNTAEMELTVPRADICFVCHERSAMQQHVASGPKKGCLDCHDAHRSDRVMLLRRNIEVNYAPPPSRPSDTKHTASKPSRRRPGLAHKQDNPAH